nr:hypothetical protein [Comamonas testosteroni]
MHTSTTSRATLTLQELLLAVEKALCTLMFLGSIAFTSVALKLIIDIA